MTLRHRIEPHVRQMIEQGGFDPERDAIALAIRLSDDPAVLDDLRVSYLVPEIKRVARDQIKPAAGIRQVGGRIQSVQSLRAEVEAEVIAPTTIAAAVFAPIRPEQLLGMKKVQVMDLKREYDQRTNQAFGIAVNYAATARFLNAVEARMDDLDRVEDVLTLDGLQTLLHESIQIQHSRSFGTPKEIPG